MRYSILCLMLLAGCANAYSYKPGSQASENHQYNDQHYCDEKAWDVFFKSNHAPTIQPLVAIPMGGSLFGSLAAGFGGTAASFALSESTSEHSKSRPYMTKEDMKPIYDKCMHDKGYVEKL